MIDCVSVRNMRLSDRQTIDSGISGRELILKAANAIYSAVDWGGKIGIISGSGNNGADGFALSMLLHRNGYDVTVFYVSDRMHDDCNWYAGEAKRNGVKMIKYNFGENMLSSFHFLVDCLLGTGYVGALRDVYRTAIREINESNAYVISVDINSGMNGDTGEGSDIVNSDLTVSIQFVKKGMIAPLAGKYIGKLICSDIGIRLAYEEIKICSKQEWEILCRHNGISADSNSVFIDDCTYLKCPDWLYL